MSHFEGALRNFLTHYDELAAAKDDGGFTAEFIALKTKSQLYRDKDTYPAETGQKPSNKKKNRFKDILPFEYTRVSLHPVAGIEGSEYINANYVTGAEDDIEYIAAQGPLPCTVNDFWRMIWYHSIEIVVMACKTVEMGKHKCELYWPSQDESMMFGSIKVTTTMEENVSNDFIIRELLAECEGEKQLIRQYHYMAWPDHGKPKSPEPILKMVEMVRGYRQRADIPIVVNCSAGCGRTGTILAIDIARSMILSKAVPKNFSVYKIVEKMRQQRPAMVQAKDQYLFVYQAVAELCRKALGIKSPPPPDLTPLAGSSSSSSSEAKGQTSGEASSSSVRSEPGSESAIIYENTQDMANQLDGSLAPPPSSSSSSDPVAPNRRSHDYINVDKDGKMKVENGSSRTKPLPSPPVKVTRKRSGVPASSLEKQSEVVASQMPSSLEPSNGGDGALLYENLQDEATKSKAPQPQPKPKPRGGGGGAQNIDVPSSHAQLNHVQAVPVGSSSPAKKQTSSETKTHLVAASASPILPRASTPDKHKPLPNIPREVSPDRSHHNKPLPKVPGEKEKDKKPPNKPLPQVPPPTTTADTAKDSGGGSKAKEEQNEVEVESMYSIVAEGIDTGPEIHVLDEVTGETVPLPGDSSLDSSKLSASGNKTSILETFLSALDGMSVSSHSGGESDEEQPPSLPSPRRRPSPPAPAPAPTLPDFGDEVAPDIPRRTDARLELLVGGGRPTRFDDPVKTAAGTVEVTDPDAVVYEQPTMFSTPVKNRSSPLRVGSPTAPIAKPTATPASSSTASSISTLPRMADPTGGGGGLGEGLGGGGHRSKGFKSIFKKGKEKKKVGARDISGPIGNPGTLVAPGMAMMPAPSLDPGLRGPAIAALESANIRYKFPGEMGYGIRISKPRGPRNEPKHWRHFTPNDVK